MQESGDAYAPNAICGATAHDAREISLLVVGISQSQHHVSPQTVRTGHIYIILALRIIESSPCTRIINTSYYTLLDSILVGTRAYDITTINTTTTTTTIILLI